VSQSRTVLSWEADATVCPSGEKITAVMESSWPSRTYFCVPEAVSQSRTVLSREADATVRPSGEKVTAVTDLSWPSRTCMHGSQDSCTIYASAINLNR
jgi:hypothetical protein